MIYGGGFVTETPLSSCNLAASLSSSELSLWSKYKRDCRSCTEVHRGAVRKRIF